MSDRVSEALFIYIHVFLSCSILTSNISCREDGVITEDVVVVTVVVVVAVVVDISKISPRRNPSSISASTWKRKCVYASMAVVKVFDSGVEKQTRSTACLPLLSYSCRQAYGL